MPIHTIKLIKRETVATKTIKLTFSKPEGFHFIAGQYGGFTLIKPQHQDDQGINRRFSLLNAPDDEHISIVTRIQNSAYKHNLETMPIGSEIKFVGPSGNFVMHDDQGKTAALIAGGIGIAPFYSMITHALKHTPEQKIILFYGNNSINNCAFLDELETLAAQYEQFRMIVTLTEPHTDWAGEKGYITDEMIIKNVPDVDNTIFYVCGSLGMVTALQQTLMELDIGDDQIKIEDFPGY